MSKQVMEQALEALKRCTKFDQRDYDAMDALEEAIKQRGQPFGFITTDHAGCEVFTKTRFKLKGHAQFPVFTSAPTIPAGWTQREIELFDGMIEAQESHAAWCDSIQNRTMATKQKGWDLERVALLKKCKGDKP
jgi:hypothetical protein